MARPANYAAVYGLYGVQYIHQRGSQVRIDGALTRPVDAAIGDLRID